jgi:hypothetical protein
MVDTMLAARCREREQLEREIHEVVRQIAKDSNAAARIAGGGTLRSFGDFRQTTRF